MYAREKHATHAKEIEDHAISRVIEIMKYIFTKWWKSKYFPIMFNNIIVASWCNICNAYPARQYYILHSASMSKNPPLSLLKNKSLWFQPLPLSCTAYYHKSMPMPCQILCPPPPPLLNKLFASTTACTGHVKENVIWIAMWMCLCLYPPI